MTLGLSSQARSVVALGTIVVLLAVPLLTSDYVCHLVAVSMIYSILAASWDLSAGYAGLFNLAHVPIFAIGAYTVGVFTKFLGLSPWLGLVAAPILGAACGALICLPVLRVKGVYILLLTYAFGQVAYQVVMGNYRYTGGTQGLVMIPALNIGSHTFGLSDNYYFILAVFLTCLICLRKAVNSHFGLSIIALRDYEEYAVSRGVPSARQRLLTLVCGSMFAGVSGALYALYLGMASPELFGWGYSMTVMSVCVLGGLASIYGPVIGAFSLTFIQEYMVSLGPWRYLIISTVTILMLRFYPGGIWGILASVEPGRLLKVSEYLFRGKGVTTNKRE